MKKFLKTAAALAVLALALACFAACKNGDDDSGQQADTPQDRAASGEFTAAVEGGSLSFSFYDDGTFEYKEALGSKTGTASGTYSAGSRAAFASGSYILTVLKIVGELAYAKLKVGDTMATAVSIGSVVADKIDAIFEDAVIAQAASIEYDYAVSGSWQDVTDLNDLVGVWLCRDKRSQKYNDNFTFAGKEYNNCAVAEEVDHFFEWKISNENGYIMTEINKKGSYDTQTITFPAPITDEEVAAIKAEEEESFNKDWHEADSEFWKVVYAVTNTKWFNKGSCIKDCPSDDTFSLKMEEGKCCFYYYGNLLYIKINKAKNGIQFFKDDTDSEPMYTAKKQ